MGGLSPGREGEGAARRKKICERRRKGGKEEVGDGKRGLGRSEAVVLVDWI